MSLFKRRRRADQPIEITEIKRVQLQPDDILIVHVDRKVTLDQAERIKEHCERFAPGHLVVVFDEGMDLDVVRAETQPPLAAGTGSVGKVTPEYCSKGHRIDPVAWRSTRWRQHCGCPALRDEEETRHEHLQAPR